MSSSGSAKLLVVGQWIIVGGLCIQLVFFGAFLITSIIFNCRILRAPTEESQISIARGLIPRDWRELLFALYIVSVLILIRSVYRVVEFVQGNNGYVISHEVYLYVFDASMMFLVMIVMNIFHPSVVLTSNNTQDTEERKSSLAESKTSSAELQC